MCLGGLHFSTVGTSSCTSGAPPSGSAAAGTEECCATSWPQLHLNKQTAETFFKPLQCLSLFVNRDKSLHVSVPAGVFACNDLDALSLQKRPFNPGTVDLWTE